MENDKDAALKARVKLLASQCAEMICRLPGVTRSDWPCSICGLPRSAHEESYMVVVGLPPHGSIALWVGDCTTNSPPATEVNA